MAMGMLETGPKLDWTRDNKIFDRFLTWKEKVEMIFSSALADCTPEQKTSYLRYWMGDQGIPLVKKWTALGKLDFSNPTRGRKRQTHLKWLYSEELLESSRSRIQT